MIEEKITNKEVEDLEKLIDKLTRKFLGLYIATGLGAIIIVFSLIYFMQHPDIIAGSLSLFFIGLVLVVINIMSIRQVKKRIAELKIDLEKLKARVF